MKQNKVLEWTPGLDVSYRHKQYFLYTVILTEFKLFKQFIATVWGSVVAGLCAINVPFKESLFTRRPYLQCLQAAISGIQKFIYLNGEILKSQKLLGELTNK